MKNSIFEPTNIKKELKRYQKELGTQFTVNSLLEAYKVDSILSIADKVCPTDDGHNSKDSENASDSRKKITVDDLDPASDMPISRYTLVYAEALDNVRGVIVVRDNEDMSINCGLIEMFFWVTNEGINLFFSPKTVLYGGDRNIRDLAEYVVKTLYL